MILVAFLRVIPGMTFWRIITTRGMEFSQSLCRMTFHGRSGLTLNRVWVPSALLIIVEAIQEALCHHLVPRASEPVRSVVTPTPMGQGSKPFQAVRGPENH